MTSRTASGAKLLDGRESKHHCNVGVLLNCLVRSPAPFWLTANDRGIKYTPVMRTKCLIASLALAATATSQAVIVWNGGGDNSNFYDNANWDFSGSVETGMPASGGNPSAATADDILILGATINETSGAFTNIEIGDGLSVTLDGTSFRFTNNNGFTGLNDAGDVTSTFNIINGSSFNAQFAAVGITVNVDSTSSIRFRGGGDPINSQVEQTTINLAPGAQLTLASVAEFTEQGADIRVGGISFSDDPSILSLNGTTATAVPEPSSVVLMFVAGLGLIRRRR